LQFEPLEGRSLLAGGLNAQYFDTATLGTLQLGRVDAEVRFDWAAGSPDASIQPDTFSVRWTGRVQPQFSENYTFYVRADDGFRLWVDGQLVASNWTNTSAVELSGQIALAAGQWYDLKLEYYENTGNASVQLAWASPSQPKEIIPASRLDPSTAPDDRGSIQQEIWTGIAGASVAALTGSANYPNDPSARGYLTQFESVAADWGDAYGQRIRGYLVPSESGVYRFAISGDDQTELYLSPDADPTHETLIASSASATGFREFTRFPTQMSASVELTAGQKYYIEALHKEDSGSDHFSVAWQTPGSSQWAVIPGDVLVPYGVDAALPAQGSILATLAAGRPRLLSTPERWQWLAGQIAVSGQVKTWYDAIKTSADSILTQALPQYAPDNRGTILSVSRSVVDHAYKLAMVYRLTGDARYAERAWDELSAAAAFPDWHPAHFLDTAEMTHAFAIGYDWLYSYWTLERRATIATALVEKGLNQALPLYRNNSSWVASSSNNWNFVCNGGMILGALAIAEEQPALVEEILAKAIPSVAALSRHFTADQGGWYEGPGYWDYTTSYQTRMLAGLETALGSDFGLGRIPGVAETGRFALLDTSPTKLSYNFADAGAGNMRGPQLFWYARRFNDPVLAWHERTNSSGSPLDLLWYDTRGAAPGAGDVRSDAHYRGDTAAYATQDVVTLRSDWNDPDATFVGFKAGKVGDSHGHLDAGSFVLDALGQRWIYDLGGDDYALPGYFGSSRWTYYRLRAEGHNTLVINPTSAADQKTGSLPTIVRQQSTADVALSVADLTAAYTGTTRVWRGIQLDRHDGSVLLQDEIEAATAADVWWFAHVKLTPSQVQISADGTSALLTSGQDRLWVKILSPGAALTLTTPTPLPTSPNPTGQNANAGYQKLAIHLPAVTSRQLAVWFVPLQPGQTPPTVLPQVAALSGWRLADDRRVWLGDIDGYAAGGAADAVYVDAVWQTQVAAALGGPLAGFDAASATQVVPMTFQFTVPDGQQVVDARLTMALLATGDASADRVYFETTNGGYAWADLGWTAPTSAATARTYDLSKRLAWLQDGALNVAVGTHVAVDWAVLDVKFGPKGLYATTTLEAAADAFVRDGSYADQNFATGDMTIKKDTGTGYNREAYLQFDLSGVTLPVTGALLCLTPLTVGGPIEHQIYSVANDAWTETGLTWNNRPVAETRVASYQPTAGASVWIDITSLVQQEAAGDGRLSLRISSTTPGADFWASYASRENANAAFRPRLVLTTLDAAPAAVWRLDGDRDGPDRDDVFRLSVEGGYVAVATAADGAPAWRRDLASLEQIVVNTLGGNDTVILDASRGVPTPSGGLVLDGGAGVDTLDLAGGTEARRTAAGLTLDGTAIAAAGFELNRFGTARLVVSGAAQGIATDNAISATTDVLVEAGGILDLGGHGTTAKVVTLANGTIDDGTLLGTSYTVQNGTIGANLGGSGGLTKNTTGKVVLSGDNSYTGTTTVYQGILNVRHAHALGVGAAAVTVSCDGATNRYSTLEFEGPDFTISGKPLNTTGGGVGGIGALRNINGNHTWIGNVTLTGGGGGSVYQSDAGQLNIVGNVTPNTTSRTLTLQGAGNGSIDGNIQNGSTVNLPLTKKGSGTWTLSGGSTYTGSTTVSAGALIVNGALAGGGRVSVGSSATLVGQLRATSIVADTLVVGAGSSVVIAETIPAVAAASVIATLQPLSAIAPAPAAVDAALADPALSPTTAIPVVVAPRKKTVPKVAIPASGRDVDSSALDQWALLMAWERAATEPAIQRRLRALDAVWIAGCSPPW
jgi:autotransporter-associated beta strand protein